MSLERRLSALKGHAATDDDPAEIPAVRVHDDGAGPCRWSGWRSGSGPAMAQPRHPWEAS